jgi:hypothetical protein
MPSIGQRAKLYLRRPDYAWDRFRELIYRNDPWISPAAVRFCATSHPTRLVWNGAADAARAVPAYPIGTYFGSTHKVGLRSAPYMWLWQSNS